MRLVDDEGNLLGVVNLVDALVVVVVFTVILAGVALVTSGPTDTSNPSVENVTRYGTVELGLLQPSVAAAIKRGDVVARSGGDAITVRDVYTVPSGDGRVRTTVRTEIRGTSSDSSGTVQFGGSDIYLGRTLKFATPDYRVKGRVVSVDEASGELQTIRVPVTITLRGISPSVADSLESGMVGHSTGDRYVQIEELEDRPASVVVADAEGTVHERDHPWKRTVRLSVSLTVRDTDVGLVFQGRRLQVGREVFLDFGRVAVQGNVTDVEYPADQ